MGLYRGFVGGDCFAVHLGDNLLQHGIKRCPEEYESGGYDAHLLLKEVEDPRRFGVTKFDERGKLMGLVEKPREPPSRYMLVEVLPQARCLRYYEGTEAELEGLEITGALQFMLEREYGVGYSSVDDWWPDMGKRQHSACERADPGERARRDIQGEVRTRGRKGEWRWRGD